MRRDLLAQAFQNPRLAAEMEKLVDTVDETEQKTGELVEGADTMRGSMVVTLAPSGAFDNERVLTAGTGIEVENDGEKAIIRVKGVPVGDGNSITLRTLGPTTLLLPQVGRVATTAGQETLSNKTLDKPLLSSFGDYADDTAAAGGGVPVGGIYRTGSTIKVRVS